MFLHILQKLGTVERGWGRMEEVELELAGVPIFPTDFCRDYPAYCEPPPSTMPNPHLPPEILDYTVDLLCDKPATLKECCLVSKSWVPRTRKHLFTDISFNSFDDLEAWKKSFPDPANSPAYHTHSLSVGCPRFITVADAEEGGWIRAFSRVVRLKVHTDFEGDYGLEVFLVPFYNFSPVLKSLQVINSHPHSRVFDLVCSLPRLEDLNIQEYQVDGADYGGIDFQPLTSPPLTGTFELDTEEAEPTIRRSLDLPGGFHFRELVLTWRNEGDLRWIMALVVGCSDTLERFDIWQTTRSTLLQFLHRSVPYLNFRLR